MKCGFKLYFYWRKEEKIKQLTHICSIKDIQRIGDFCTYYKDNVELVILCGSSFNMCILRVMTFIYPGTVPIIILQYTIVYVRPLAP